MPRQGPPSPTTPARPRPVLTRPRPRRHVSAPPISAPPTTQIRPHPRRLHTLPTSLDRSRQPDPDPMPTTQNLLPILLPYEVQDGAKQRKMARYPSSKLRLRGAFPTPVHRIRGPIHKPLCEFNSVKLWCCYQLLLPYGFRGSRPEGLINWTQIGPAPRERPGPDTEGSW